MNDTKPPNITNFLIKETSKHSKDIVTYAAQQLSVSRMTIYRHLQKLIANNKIIQTGKKKGTQYFLKSASHKQLTFEITKSLGEFDVWTQHYSDQLAKLPINVFNICEYGFLEIFNNAIDHSEGKRITVQTTWKEASIEIIISDDGIGVFQKLQNKFKFDDKREGILNLSKGKLTTDPDNHSGEGIFFTSQAFDTFDIEANHLLFSKDNLIDDWTMDVGSNKKGTCVRMAISFNSKRDLRKIFESFQTEDDFAFDKTSILVALSKFKEERLVSRSQAKRILFGLEKFKEVVLDFKDITTVGQGFVDEIFRVFKLKQPDINITYKNANENITFMIERGIATAKHNE